MAVREIRVSSGTVRGARAPHGSEATLSTASVRCCTLTKVLTSAWSSSSTRRWPEDHVIREGYREMGPTNLRLAKEFSPKVRNAWPEW